VNTYADPTYIKSLPHPAGEKQVGDSDPNGRPDVNNRVTKNLSAVLKRSPCSRLSAGGRRLVALDQHVTLDTAPSVDFSKWQIPSVHPPEVLRDGLIPSSFGPKNGAMPRATTKQEHGCLIGQRPRHSSPPV
jgi:hypothetical protein